MPRGNPTRFVNTRFTEEQLASLDVAISEWNATHPKEKLNRGSFVRRAIDRLISETMRKRQYNRKRKCATLDYGTLNEEAALLPVYVSDTDVVPESAPDSLSQGKPG